MKAFVILLAVTLAWRCLRNASAQLSTEQFGYAFISWVLGCALLAAVWRFA